MTLTQAIKKLRPSVVQINVEFVLPAAGPGQQPQVATSRGSGFFINRDGYVITARHVVTPPDLPPHAQRGRQFIGIAFPDIDNPGGLQLRASFQLIGFEVVGEDARHDLALLKLRQNPFKEPRVQLTNQPGGVKSIEIDVVTLSLKRPEDGEPIAASGYPLNIPSLVTTSGGVASAWAYDEQEVQLPGHPQGLRFPDFADVYLADLTVNHGNSGGPVYSVSSGAVIGVCVAARFVPVQGPPNIPLSYNSGISLVVPSKYIVELLKKHGLTAATI
ncbi:MAG TPA: S1C family serine protease [Pyrinomonadaceae bacterium]|jgi:S1-C subfamily serine protease|nr:S1C family serine protease [Pyrinomonadaceae bacterium]